MARRSVSTLGVFASMIAATIPPAATDVARSDRGIDVGIGWDHGQSRGHGGGFTEDRSGRARAKRIAKRRAANKAARRMRRARR